jgi:hypothetical protein
MGIRRSESPPEPITAAQDRRQISTFGCGQALGKDEVDASRTWSTGQPTTPTTGGQAMLELQLKAAVKKQVKGHQYYVFPSPASGVCNVVAPTPVTNRQFAETLGRVLHRPTILAVPNFMLKATGRMGREMLLSSQRVAVGKLNAAALKFRDAELEPMLYRVPGIDNG